MAGELNTGELIALLGHFQRDIEQIKQRQWRDFHASLLAQGGLLFLSKPINEPVLLTGLSVILWLVGTWFIFEGDYVLNKVYRVLKDGCTEAIGRESKDLLHIIDPKGVPSITGKGRREIYLVALFVVAFLVIIILAGWVHNPLLIGATFFSMLVLLVSLCKLASRLWNVADA